MQHPTAVGSTERRRESISMRTARSDAESQRFVLGETLCISDGRKSVDSTGNHGDVPHGRDCTPPMQRFVPTFSQLLAKAGIGPDTCRLSAVRACGYRAASGPLRRVTRATVGRRLGTFLGAPLLPSAATSAAVTLPVLRATLLPRNPIPPTHGFVCRHDWLVHHASRSRPTHRSSHPVGPQKSRRCLKKGHPRERIGWQRA